MSTELLVEAIGWLGAALLLLAYGLLSSKKIGSGLAYQMMNLVGSVALAVNAMAHRALPSVVVNLVWLVIALFALRAVIPVTKPVRDRRATQSAGSRAS